MLSERKNRPEFGNNSARDVAATGGNSNGGAKFKAFTIANQANSPQNFVPINGQAANGGFALIASLVDVNIASGPVVKSAVGGNAGNSASFNNDMNQSNDA